MNFKMSWIFSLCFKDCVNVYLFFGIAFVSVVHYGDPAHNHWQNIQWMEPSPLPPFILKAKSSVFLPDSAFIVFKAEGVPLNRKFTHQPPLLESNSLNWMMCQVGGTTYIYHTMMEMLTINSHNTGGLTVYRKVFRECSNWVVFQLGETTSTIFSNLSDFYTSHTRRFCEIGM